MATKKTAKKDEDLLPGQEEQEAALNAVRLFAASPKAKRTREALLSIKNTPPQSLLFEGGIANERYAASLYWASLLNCKSPSADGAPCLSCSICQRISSLMHRDLFMFDGRLGSIKIAEIREMRSVLGEKAHEANYRAVIFCEGQSIGEQGANALLKSLEEPRPGTVFVLTAPQRERLLPTLVSRSWVLTMPWSSARESVNGGAFGKVIQDSPQVREWGDALLTFTQSGKGWMQRTAARGAVDNSLAMQVVLFCQRSLVLAMSGGASGYSKLEVAFSTLPPEKLAIAGEILAGCQDSLNNTVNPALVLDWLATKMFFVFVTPKK